MLCRDDCLSEAAFGLCSPANASQRRTSPIARRARSQRCSPTCRRRERPAVRAPDPRASPYRLRARNKGRYFRDPRISSSQRNQIMLISILAIFIVLIGIYLVLANGESLDF